MSTITEEEFQEVIGWMAYNVLLTLYETREGCKGWVYFNFGCAEKLKILCCAQNDGSFPWGLGDVRGWDTLDYLTNPRFSHKFNFLIATYQFSKNMGFHLPRTPYDILSEDVIDDIFLDIMWSIDYFKRIYTRIENGIFIKTFKKKEKMDAKAVIYRACFKAYWNPHCEMGLRMAENRYNKMLEIK